jgi:hypothetical protein
MNDEPDPGVRLTAESLWETIVDHFSRCSSLAAPIVVEPSMAVVLQKLPKLSHLAVDGIKEASIVGPALKKRASLKQLRI